jgi:hypothetical protein
MVGSQIDTLTFGPSFGHNLCCKYLNGSCEPILGIYISKAFQWYKNFFNLMSFDPSIRTSIPKVNFHSVWAHSLTLLCTLESMNIILGLHFQLTFFHALALIVSPRLGSWHYLHKKNEIDSIFQLFHQIKPKDLWWYFFIFTYTRLLVNNGYIKLISNHKWTNKYEKVVHCQIVLHLFNSFKCGSLP